MPDRDRIIATVGPDDVDEVADLLVERFLS
jgi:hypothetical protein